MLIDPWIKQNIFWAVASVLIDFLYFSLFKKPSVQSQDEKSLRQSGCIWLEMCIFCHIPQFPLPDSTFFSLCFHYA